MPKTFIDAETGEIFEGITGIRTEAQDEAYKQKQSQDNLAKYRNKADKHFTFVEMERDAMLNSLTNKQLGYFLVLQTYTDYNNMLRRAEGSTLPMRQSDIRKALRISDNRTLTNLMELWESQGIIHWEIVTMYGKEHKAYFVNEAYSFKKGLQAKFSSRKTSKAVKLFTEDLQALYEQKKVKPADIGLIYKCIQYVHYDSNYLVSNPNEKDMASVEAFTADKLAGVLEMSRQELYNKLGSLKYPVQVAGETMLLHVFAKVKVGCHVHLKINPLLVYRKTGEPTYAEYAEFILSYHLDQERKGKAK